MMKGFLRSAEALLQLAPKITTIGREGCDITIQSANVERQHAVIQYSEEEGSFILQDLSSAQGTYINDCCIQNAAVRLAPLDTIRFGHSGAVYQLIVQDDPLPQQRGVWTVPSRSVVNPYHPQPANGLPYLNLPSAVSPQQQQTMPLAPAIVGTIPQPMPPSTLRTRPLSATGRKPAFVTDSLGSPSAVHKAGWVGGGLVRTADNSPTHELVALQDREQRMMRMGDEIGRLIAIEADADRKTQTIDQLTAELAQLRHKMATSAAKQNDQEITRKLLQLEQEAAAKSSEVSMLREQLLKLESCQRRGSTMPPADYADKLQELHEVRCELEKVKKERGSTSALISQLQRDTSNKDSTASKLTRDNEILHKEIRDRDVQLAALTAKFARVKSLSKVEQEQETRDRELLGLRNQFKSAENKVYDQNEIIKTLRADAEKMRLTAEHLQEEHDKARAEAEHSKSAFLEAQQLEQAAKVDLQQAVKQHERFRSRIIQVAFSTPGVKYPDDEVKDDVLAELLRKITEERSDLQRQLTDLKDKVKILTSSDKKSEQSLRKLKDHLFESVQHFRDSGLRGEQLKHELGLLQALPVEGNDAVQTVKDRLLDVLTIQLHWQDDIESALENCGVADVRVSKDAPGAHVKALFKKWEASIKDKESIEARIKMAEAEHKAELERRQQSAKQECLERVADAVAKVKHEDEQKLRDSLKEIQRMETEKRADAVGAERKKIEEIDINMAQLRQTIVDMQAEASERAVAASENVKRIDEYKRLEEVLVKKMDELEEMRLTEVKSATDKLEDEKKQREEEVSGYKEQIKQHSVTICSLEERLDRAVKKNKDLQSEVMSLRQSMQEHKNQLASKTTQAVEHHVPRSQIIIQREPAPDPDGLQQIIVTLRAECLDYKRKVQEQADVIMALRRDLAGASARMQDMTGELTEAQKQDLEKNRALIRQKEKEAAELQQQMAKLSAIVDKQGDSTKELEAELSKHKNELQKQRADIAQKDDLLRNVQERLTATESERQRQTRERDEDGRVTSELCSIGAACRGERHQLVIERQREALAELRLRVKAIEQMRPATSQPDAAVQQMNTLRRQLAEMRTAQATEEDLPRDPVSSNAVERAVNKARGVVDVTSADGGNADYERSALREMSDSLEESEKSYLTLLRAMAACLEMEEVAGLRSMAHIPHDERLRLASERERIVGLLSQKVRAMRERLGKKDELLLSYEHDLAKLRQAELLVDRKSHQVEELAQAVQQKLDETAYLRESLSRTKENLHQEKRLNSAIKQKKTFHLENEKGPFTSSAHHRCPPEDIFGKEASKKKKQLSKLRKQDFEIRTLKEEVARKDEELRHTSQLINLDDDKGRGRHELFA